MINVWNLRAIRGGAMVNGHGWLQLSFPFTNQIGSMSTQLVM